MTSNFLLMLSRASSIKKDCHAYQSLDNVDMYKNATFFSQNILCGSRVIRVFANCRRMNGWTVNYSARRSLVTILHTIRWTMLKYISIQSLNQIIQTVQELRAFSHKNSNFQLMLSKASSIKKGCYAYQSLDNVDM